VYTPQRVARKIVATIDRPGRQVHAGFANPFVVAGFRFLPGLYDVLVTPLMRIAALAKDRVDPSPGNVLESRPEKNSTRGHWRGL
jgi:hypothetical protein